MAQIPAMKKTKKFGDATLKVKQAKANAEKKSSKLEAMSIVTSSSFFIMPRQVSLTEYMEMAGSITIHPIPDVLSRSTVTNSRPQ